MPACLRTTLLTIWELAFKYKPTEADVSASDSQISSPGPCWSGPGMNQSRWNIEIGPHRFWDVCPGLCVCCFKLSQSKKASEKINKMLLILFPFHVWAHWGHLICKTILFVEFNGWPWFWQQHVCWSFSDKGALFCPRVRRQWEDRT